MLHHNIPAISLFFKFNNKYTFTLMFKYLGSNRINSKFMNKRYFKYKNNATFLFYIYM